MITADIYFDEENHKYYIKDTKEELISVTTLLKTYEKKKDWDQIAESYSYKHGFTKEYWLKKWDDMKKEGLHKGTRIHKKKEELIRTYKKSNVFENTNYINDLIKQSYEQVIYLPEFRLYNVEYGICGTADLICIKNGEFVIIDYKTNKKLSTEGFRKETLKAPLNSLQNCSMDIYTMQLSIYSWMLEQFGAKCIGLEIHHIKEITNDFTLDQTLITDIHKITYKKDLVIKLVNHYQKQKLKKLKK